MFEILGMIGVPSSKGITLLEFVLLIVVADIWIDVVSLEGALTLGTDPITAVSLVCSFAIRNVNSTM